MGSTQSSRAASAAERYNAFTHGVHRLLPGWLSWIPPTWIGWAVLSLTTFALDIALLSLLVHVGKVPYPVAVSIGFGVAAIANFLLNRWLNFRAEGDLAKQTGKQSVVVVSNYVLWVLGFSSLLEWSGVPPEVSRLCAAVVEGLYMYLMMRFWVFPRRHSVLDDEGRLLD